MSLVSPSYRNNNVTKDKKNAHLFPVEIIFYSANYQIFIGVFAGNLCLKESMVRGENSKKTGCLWAFSSNNSIQRPITMGLKCGYQIQGIFDEC